MERNNLFYIALYQHYGPLLGRNLDALNGSHMGPYFKNTCDIPKCFRKMALPFHTIDIHNVSLSY